MWSMRVTSISSFTLSPRHTLFLSVYVFTIVSLSLSLSFSLSLLNISLSLSLSLSFSSSIKEFLFGGPAAVRRCGGLGKRSCYPLCISFENGGVYVFVFSYELSACVCVCVMEHDCKIYIFFLSLFSL